MEQLAQLVLAWLHLHVSCTVISRISKGNERRSGMPMHHACHVPKNPLSIVEDHPPRPQRVAPHREVVVDTHVRK